jgi:hypothetical protein
MRSANAPMNFSQDRTYALNRRRCCRVRAAAGEAVHGDVHQHHEKEKDAEHGQGDERKRVQSGCLLER